MKKNLLYKKNTSTVFWIIIIFLICFCILYMLCYSNNKNTTMSLSKNGINQSAQDLIRSKLKQHCHIEINGNQPQDIHVHNDKFYSMVMNESDLGLAESYMLGYWTTRNLYLTLYNLLAGQSKLQSIMNYNVQDGLTYVKNYFINQQNIEKAELNVHQHYDIGNDLYVRMLDKNLQYTCAFFQDTDNLNIAQEQKMKLIGQKLNLKRGQTVLDIGSGWGGLVNYLAQTYQVKVLGITLSKEQIKYARHRYGKNKYASYEYMDYRKIPKNMKFDRIVSVGMLEHVGSKNFDEYFKVVHDHLHKNGIALIHTIGTYKNKGLNGKFIQKYIFPGGYIPSFQELSNVVPSYFQIHDWHNFGKYYAKTLKGWYKNINSKWHEIPHYNQQFRNMWNFYLLGCAAVFELCDLQLWQLLLSKDCIDLPKRDCLIKRE